MTGAVDKKTQYGPISRIWQALALAAIVGVGNYLPHVAFEVAPFPTGNSGPTVAGTNSHTPSVMAIVTPETAREKQVKADIFKWCGFCHTLEKDGVHKLGPNLWGIYGQRAGTAPNFTNYSDAMIKARDRSLVWDDKALMAYVHSPEKFMPGTNMMISIGDIEDPEDQRLVVNILKKVTNGDLVRIEGSTQP